MDVQKHVTAWSLTLSVAVGASTMHGVQMGPAVTVLSRSAPDAVQVLKNGIATNVRRQVVRIAVRHSEREEVREGFLDVIMLFDAQTGVHWWGYQRLHTATDEFKGFANQFAYYFSNREAFGFCWLSTLRVREIRGRRGDLAEVERVALADVERQARALLFGAMEDYAVDISVRRQLGDFLHKPFDAAPPPPPEIVKLEGEASGDWRITLKGPNKDFAEVTLDGAYSVKSVKRLPPR